MAFASADTWSPAPAAFNFGEQRMCGVDDWFRDLDFSDLPQLPIETEVENLPLLDDLLLLDETGSPDSVSSIWPVESTHSAYCRQQYEDCDVTDEDIEAWEGGITSLFQMPAGVSNCDEADTPYREEQGSSPSSIDLSSENAQCHNESAGAQAHVGNALGSSAEPQGVDLGVKAQSDPSQKKQMRLIRNRELAFESRQRKKSYIKELESKCKVLEQERNHLQHQISFFSSENTVLKQELSRVKRKKVSTGVAEPAALKGSLPSEFLLHLTCLFFLALVSLLGNLYLDLSLQSIRLQTFEVKAGGPVKGDVSRKASSFALRVSCCVHTSTALRKVRSFSFWRRRQKLVKNLWSVRSIFVAPHLLRWWIHAMHCF